MLLPHLSRIRQGGVALGTAERARSPRELLDNQHAQSESLLGELVVGRHSPSVRCHILSGSFVRKSCSRKHDPIPRSSSARMPARRCLGISA